MKHSGHGALVEPVDRAMEPRLLAAINAKGKSLGSLGLIEALAVHIGLATRSLRPSLGEAALAVFTGDQGAASEGVTAYLSEVAALNTQMALDGEAGGNTTARGVGAQVFLINGGVLSPAPHPTLIEKSVPKNSRDFLVAPAMTEQEAHDAFQAGQEMANDLKKRGFGILAVGEIGIGSTSSASLVAHCVTGAPISNLNIPGAGKPPDGLEHERDVLAHSHARAPIQTGFDAVREFGCFEIAMMAGAMIGGAKVRQIVVVDGFMATVAACAAVAIDGNIRDYLLFSHFSPESGHVALLEWLNAKPLLDRQMRPAESAGAPLAIPLVRMAENLLDWMADLPGGYAN